MESHPPIIVQADSAYRKLAESLNILKLYQKIEVQPLKKCHISRFAHKLMIQVNLLIKVTQGRGGRNMRLVANPEKAQQNHSIWKTLRIVV
jgi:hypothetical protein